MSITLSPVMTRLPSPKVQIKVEQWLGSLKWKSLVCKKKQGGIRHWESLTPAVLQLLRIYKFSELQLSKPMPSPVILEAGRQAGLALLALYEGHILSVIHKVKSKSRVSDFHGIDLDDDLWQEAALFFLSRLPLYESEDAGNFWLYVKNFMATHLTRFLTAQGKSGGIFSHSVYVARSKEGLILQVLPFSALTQINDEGDEVDYEPATPDETPALDMRLDIERALNHLRPRAREIVCLRYGFGNYDAKSIDEIARLYGISCQRVNQILNSAFQYLAPILSSYAPKAP